MILAFSACSSCSSQSTKYVTVWREVKLVVRLESQECSVTNTKQGTETSILHGAF